MFVRDPKGYPRYRSTFESIPSFYNKHDVEFTLSAVNMSQIPFAIIIPALNEEKSLPDLLTALGNLNASEIIVVNDFSRDGTAQVAGDLGATVLDLANPLGAWGATQAGLRYALARQYPYVVTMDADGQHLSSEIVKLIDHCETSKANIVIGSCVARGSLMRHWAWRLLRYLSGLSIRDLTSGFRLYDHNAQRVGASLKASLLDYQDIGFLLQAKMAGLSISETPVEMRTRTQGASRVFRNWWVVAYYMAYSGLLGLSKRQLGTARERKPV